MLLTCECKNMNVANEELLRMSSSNPCIMGIISVSKTCAFSVTISGS